MTLQTTLLTDGSSDAVLLPILRWVFRQLTPEAVELRWADLRGLPKPPRHLSDRLKCAVQLFSCQVLFVHRDAEGQTAGHRFDEITRANRTGLSHVCVIPVRMQEAWLLLSEDAVRMAAGRPSGKESLDLSHPTQWESLPDPKNTLHSALVTASGAKG